MVRYNLFSLLLSITIMLMVSSCIGIVSGDLKDTPQTDIYSCTYSPALYGVTYSSNIEDRHDDDNPAWVISFLTVGIIPTYWTDTVQSEVTISRNGEGISTYRYNSKIHKYYGIFWLLFFNNNRDKANELDSDEAGVITFSTGIRHRSLYKAITTHGAGKDSYCERSNEEDTHTGSDADLLMADVDSSDVLQPDKDVPVNTTVSLYQAGAFEKASEVLLRELANINRQYQYEKEMELRVRLAITYHKMGKQTQCFDALRPYEKTAEKIMEELDELYLSDSLTRRELMQWVKKTKALCACSNNDPTGCFQLEADFVLEKALAAAFTQYGKACNENNGFACFTMGLLCDNHKSLNCRSKAVAHFSSSCDLDYPRGCSVMGDIYYDQNIYDIAPDKKKLPCTMRKPVSWAVLMAAII